MKEAGAKARTAEARQDFEDALERLRLGKPKHPDLARLATQGKLRITVASVALEACRSRTLIGFAGCRFPDIRDRIIKCGGRDESCGRGVTRVVEGLRRANAALRDEIQALRSQQALMLARIIDAEGDAALIRADQTAASPGSKVGNSVSQWPMPVRPRTRLHRGKGQQSS